jgi:glycerol-3-phosphate dehydrogenase
MGSAGNWDSFLRTHTVEGVAACRAVHELIAGKGLDVHLLDTLFEVLFEERPAPEAMRHFLRSFTY